MKTEQSQLDAQQLLNRCVLEYFQEQKHKRRWRWVWRMILFLFIVWFLYSIISTKVAEVAAQSKDHVGLIDINGNMFTEESNNADDFMKSMTKAYKNPSMKAVILRINSPGGSPVQADYIYNAIDYFRQKHSKIKVYAVCEDICASAAYYVAAAADEIYASPASMVGSIGVIFNGFGFVDAMQKVGVTRRAQFAGKNKNFLDPFTPQNPEQENKMQIMLDLVHKDFIDKVKKGRGARLHVNDDTFSGLIWTGIQAKEMGLIDGFASSGQLARNTIKIDRVVDYTSKQSVWQQMSRSVGTAFANVLPHALGLRQGLQ